MTTNQLIAKLHDEIVEYRGEVPNLASFLRVSCLRYLTLVLGRERPDAVAVPAEVARIPGGTVERPTVVAYGTRQ